MNILTSGLLTIETPSSATYTDLYSESLRASAGVSAVIGWGRTRTLRHLQAYTVAWPALVMAVECYGRPVKEWNKWMRRKNRKPLPLSDGSQGHIGPAPRIRKLSVHDNTETAHWLRYNVLRYRLRHRKWPTAIYNPCHMWVSLKTVDICVFDPEYMWSKTPLSMAIHNNPENHSPISSSWTPHLHPLSGLRHSIPVHTHSPAQDLCGISTSAQTRGLTVARDPLIKTNLV